MDDSKVQSIVKVKEEKEEEEEVEADYFDYGDTEVIMQSIVKEEVKEEVEDEFEADNINDDDKCVDEDVKPPLCVFITSDGKYIEEGPFGSINVQDPFQTNGIETDAEHESGTPGPRTKKKSRLETVHKKWVTAKQDLTPGEIQPTDNESKRLKKPPKTSAERVREYRARKKLLEQQRKQQQDQDAKVEITDVRLTGPSEDNKVHGLNENKGTKEKNAFIQKPRQIVGVRSKKTPKTAAERARECRARKKLKQEQDEITGEVRSAGQIIGVRSKKPPKTPAQRARECRARKKLLKQQSKQQQDEITGDVRSAGPSEDNLVHGLNENKGMKEKNGEVKQQWRERGADRESQKMKQAKSDAQRMREYRARKKLAMEIQLKQQSVQDLESKVITSLSHENQRAGPSTINSISAELTRRGIHNHSNKLKHQDIVREGMVVSSAGVIDDCEMMIDEMTREKWWNDWQGKWENPVKTYRDPASSTNFIWYCQESNPGTQR